MTTCCPIARDLSQSQQQMLLALIAIGQTHILEFPSDTPQSTQKLKTLLDTLWEVEKFYAPVGGLIGYHNLSTSLLSTTREEKPIQKPDCIDITVDTPILRKSLLHAIEHWDKACEIYPVGGAADRLKLQDDISHAHLPAARLQFAGRPLLSGMMRDLQAREYLHYKLHGKQLTTPVVMMTSHEKNNAAHIRAICEESHWFHRPSKAFKLITQPLVPTLDRQGKWILTAPLEPLFKPGGHGALWQLMLQTNTFDWLKGRTFAFMRQINNPIASLDGSALTFLGLGLMRHKAFGFASCAREPSACEGINVLTERDGNQVLTNVEYCQFTEPPDASYPANTNILFAALGAAEQAARKNPLPGMLLNFRDDRARLEAMMQNLADAIPAHSTYLTHNHRHKTISTTKRKFAQGSPWLETPEGCFFDLIKNAHELLTQCQFQLPLLDADTFFTQGPPFTFLYHPALGPLYSIIAQKLRGGRLAPGSELCLELADADIENLDLDGSLIIETPAVCGHLQNDITQFSNRTGRCILHNLTVRNRGIAHAPDQPYWKHTPNRLESLHIRLGENSEFVARDITLSGDQIIEVPDNRRCIAHASGLIYEPIEAPSAPMWNYFVDDDARIGLRRR